MNRYEGSLAHEISAKLRVLDFGNQAMLLGAGLLGSLLPFLVLLSAFANERVDEDIALRLGLHGKSAEIVQHLFHSAPASLNFATVTSLLFVAAGTFAVASSLQQIYEKVYDQEHRGMRDWPRLVIWVAVLCAAIVLDGWLGGSARDLAAGRLLALVATFAVMTPFFWWTIHFLLGGRLGWRPLWPAALATGACFAGLGVFSELYFSSTIITDSRTYGRIGAVLGILTWLVAIGAVIIIGAIAGSVWQQRHAGPTSLPSGDIP